MSEEKYLTLEKLERKFAASPVWRKSGEGEFTAAQYYISVRFIEDMDCISLELDSYPASVESFIHIRGISLEEGCLRVSTPWQDIHLILQPEEEELNE